MCLEINKQYSQKNLYRPARSTATDTQPQVPDRKFFARDDHWPDSRSPQPRLQLLLNQGRLSHLDQDSQAQGRPFKTGLLPGKDRQQCDQMLE